MNGWLARMGYAVGLASCILLACSTTLWAEDAPADASPTETPGVAPQARRMNELGLSLGLNLGFGVGGSVIADYTLNERWQLHAAYQSDEADEMALSFFLFAATIKTHRDTTLASARYFFTPTAHWFAGAGVGQSSVTQRYQDSLGVDVKSSATFNPVFAELGYQTPYRLYITLNAYASATTNLKETNNTNLIPTTFDLRNKASSDLKAAETYSGIGVSMGWFF